MIKPFIRRFHNGQIRTILYEHEDIYHRTDGPALQQWNIDGILIEEIWSQHGIKHRSDGPAWRRWNDAGAPITEEWCYNGVLHRDNGPAWQVRKNSGAVKESWYLHGREMIAGEIEKLLRPENIMAALRALPQPIFEEIAAVYRAV